MITLESEHSGDDAVAVATRSTVLLVGGDRDCDLREAGKGIHLSGGGFRWWCLRWWVVALCATGGVGVAFMGFLYKN